MRTTPPAAAVVRLGIAAPGRGGTARSEHLGVLLDAVPDEVFDGVPVPLRTPTWFRRPEGDHTTLVIPPSVPKAWLAGGLPRLLATALRRRNRHLNAYGRLRLRVAIDHGDVVLRPPYFGGAAIALVVAVRRRRAAGGPRRGPGRRPRADRVRRLPHRPGGRGGREIGWLRTGPDGGTRNTGADSGLAPA